MWRCYFSMLGLVAYLHFVLSLNPSTSMLLSHQKETQGTSRYGNNVLTLLAVLPASPSPTAYSALSTHNDDDREVTKSEPADFDVGVTGLEGALSFPLRMGNETTHQDSATIERDDGSQKHESSKRPSTLQNCPAEPHICRHDDCGGNNGNFRCATQNTVYSLCQCCPDMPPVCTEQRCAAPSATVCMDHVTSSSQLVGRCESELLKGCSCTKEQLCDYTSFADVEIYPDSEDERLEGPGSEAYEQAVKHAVEMFGGIDQVPGYVPPAKDGTGP